MKLSTSSILLKMARSLSFYDQCYSTVYICHSSLSWGFPDGSVGGEDPLEKEMETHQFPVFLPGESHGQKSLAGCSPWGRKRVERNLVTKQQQFGHLGFSHISVIIKNPGMNIGVYIFFPNYHFYILWIGIQK